MNTQPRMKHLIIHGHFYQPPRENPWTERIDRQESAAPYHDWNEKITRECYLPNAYSRRLDGYGRITKLVNNYEWISFNFGPTILSWFESRYPALCERILEADGASAARCAGHGNAIAQPYNHMIMPLAQLRDQETQIIWGVYDFEKRFGRKPEGIWIPETAINETTLDTLKSFGFRFTVLSPHQAQRIRPLDHSSDWRDVSDGSIPAGFCYRCFAPGKKGKRSRSRYLDVFFYDAPLSTQVSFNHLLRNGDRFAEAIDAACARGGNDLVVIATDGEIYGHHEPFADMALSYLIDVAAARHGLHMTNFGAYLDGHEPAWEVQIKTGRDGEGTAWSCSHGVGRWKEDCGCNVGAPPGWNQRWREPLRSGLDRLRDASTALFETEAATLLENPWKARNEYISVIQNRQPEHSRAFTARHAVRPLSDAETSRVLSLLESQRHAMLMFTSCGWFFNDISGIESEQLLRYAARSMELVGGAHAVELEHLLLGELGRAQSNVAGRGTGADVFRRARGTSAVDTRFLAGQYAIISSLFGEQRASAISRYGFTPIDRFSVALRSSELQGGAVEIASPFTLASSRYRFLTIVENHAWIDCLLAEMDGDEKYHAMKAGMLALPPHADARSVLESAAPFFEGQNFALSNLFPEDREETLMCLARQKIERLEERFTELYLENRDLLRMLHEASLRPPPSLLVPAQTVLTKRLAAEVDRWERSLDIEGLAGIRDVLRESGHYGVPIATESTSASFLELILETIDGLRGTLALDRIEALLQFTVLCEEIGVTLRQDEIQNKVFALLEDEIEPAISRVLSVPDEGAALKAAALRFLDLAQHFNFNTDHWRERLH